MYSEPKDQGKHALIKGQGLLDFEGIMWESFKKLSGTRGWMVFWLHALEETAMNDMLNRNQ